MNDTNPADTIRHAAAQLRTDAENRTHQDRLWMRATADQWDALANRHRECEHYLDKGWCRYCHVGEWPCPDMDDVLTVALAYLHGTGA